MQSWWAKVISFLFDEDVIVVAIIMLLFNLITVQEYHFSSAFIILFLAGYGQDFPLPFNQYWLQILSNY